MRSVITTGNAYINDVYNTTIVARIHGLRPDTSSLSALTTLAQLMSDRRIDESGSFISLTRTELDSLGAQTAKKMTGPGAEIRP